jgi:CBS domain-containing protein
VPLEELTADAVEQAGLDPGRPTVVYCYDHECDLSARGSARLATLGFGDVYDYAASKVAWMAEGLPVEGATPSTARAGAIAHRAPECRLTETVGDVSARLGRHEDVCVVVDDDRVVLGVVRAETAQLPPATPVTAALQPAPPSVRPSITARELADSMEHDGRTYVLVTTPRGELLGIVTRADLHGDH